MGLPFDIETSVALVCAISVALLVWLIAFALNGGVGYSRRARRRLNLVRDRAEGILPTNAVTLRPLSRQQSATPRIDRLAGWFPRRDLLAVRLARTGRTISVGQYAMTTVGLTVTAASLLALALPIGVIPNLLIGLLVGTALPHMLIGKMGRRRVAAFIALFPEAIDLMVRALRSGLPISEAIVGAGQEIGDPVGSELRRVEAGMRLGRDLESLLWDIAQRIDVPEFRFFIIALGVQRETGGNLAETLANLADILRRRRQMQAKVRAMSSETRATTMILGSLPLIMILLLLLTTPGYLVPLYTDIRGLTLDGLALTMLGSGILIMNKLARFEI
jgi:tight adherence protein B